MEELNEGRHQVKRKYGEYDKIRINENGAIVRDTIIKYVAKNYVTEEDLHNHLIRLEEDRAGSKINKEKWFKRNQKFFTTFEKKGTSYYSLSKYGQRVYEMILKRDSAPKEINESKYRNIPSLSESIALDEFEAEVNEGKSILGTTLANKWTSSDAAMNDLESFLESVYKSGDRDIMDDMQATFKVLSQLAKDYLKHMK
jgi:hypothetical protein